MGGIKEIEGGLERGEADQIGQQNKERW